MVSQHLFHQNLAPDTHKQITRAPVAADDDHHAGVCTLHRSVGFHGRILHPVFGRSVAQLQLTWLSDARSFRVQRLLFRCFWGQRLFCYHHVIFFKVFKNLVNLALIKQNKCWENNVKKIIFDCNKFNLKKSFVIARNFLNKFC